MTAVRLIRKRKDTALVYCGKIIELDDQDVCLPFTKTFRDLVISINGLLQKMFRRNEKTISFAG